MMFYCTTAFSRLTNWVFALLLFWISSFIIVVIKQALLFVFSWVTLRLQFICSWEQYIESYSVGWKDWVVYEQCLCTWWFCYFQVSVVHARTQTHTHTSLCPSVRCCLKDQYFLYIIFLFENEKYVFTGTKSQNICGCILIRWQFEINDFVVICWPQCFHGDLIWFLVMAVSCDGHFHFVSFGILGQQSKEFGEIWIDYLLLYMWSNTGP